MARDTESNCRIPVSNLSQRYTQMHDQPYQLGYIYEKSGARGLYVYAYITSEQCDPSAADSSMYQTIKTMPNVSTHSHQARTEGTSDTFQDKACSNVNKIIIFLSCVGRRLTSPCNRNYIPNITIVKLPRKTWPLQIGIPTQFVLKFTNPLYEEMHVTLATPQMRRKQRPAEKTKEIDEDEDQMPETTKIRGKVNKLNSLFFGPNE